MTKIIDFSEYHKAKRENELTDNILNLIEVSDFRIGTLKIVLEMVNKIVYFSGDTEEGDSRNFNICYESQLLRTAQFQLYTFSLKGDVLKTNVSTVIYLYVLYFENFVSQELKENIVDTLWLECEINSTNNFINSKKVIDEINDSLKE